MGSECQSQPPGKRFRPAPRAEKFFQKELGEDAVMGAVMGIVEKAFRRKGKTLRLKPPPPLLPAGLKDR
jgi:hypothetical protein